MDAALLHLEAALTSAGNRTEAQQLSPGPGLDDGKRTFARLADTWRRMNDEDSAEPPAYAEVQKGENIIGTRKVISKGRAANVNDDAPTLAPFFLADESSRLPVFTPEQILRTTYSQESTHSNAMLSREFNEFISNFDFSRLENSALGGIDNQQAGSLARDSTNGGLDTAQPKRLFNDSNSTEHCLNYVKELFDSELESEGEREVQIGEGFFQGTRRDSHSKLPNNLLSKSTSDLCAPPSSLMDSQATNSSGMFSPTSSLSKTTCASDPYTSRAAARPPRPQTSHPPPRNSTSTLTDIPFIVGYDADLMSDDESKSSGDRMRDKFSTKLTPDDAAFFGPDWEEIIDNVQWSVSLYILIENGFPSKAQLNARIPGYINAAVHRFRQKYGREPSYDLYTKYYKNIVRMIRRIVSCFRGQLKMICRELVTKYGFIPTARMSRKNLEETIRREVENMFGVEGLFIRFGFDSNGEPDLFSHPVLCEVCLIFVYFSEFSLGNRFKAIFSNAVPKQAVALITSAMACCICEYSTGKYTPVLFDYENFGAIYTLILKIITALEDIPYYRSKLDHIREEWARVGVIQLQRIAAAHGLANTIAAN